MFIATYDSLQSKLPLECETSGLYDLNNGTVADTFIKRS